MPRYKGGTTGRPNVRMPPNAYPYHKDASKTHCFLRGEGFPSIVLAVMPTDGLRRAEKKKNTGFPVYESGFFTRITTIECTRDLLPLLPITVREGR